MANKPDKIPSSLRWTTFWIVFALIVLSVALALALYSAGQYLVLLLGVDVQPDAYMLWVPLIALAVSAILGTVLAIVLNRYYLRPVAQLLAATRAVAEGDFSVRVPARKNPRDLAECIRSFNKMTAELGRLELLQTDFVNTFSHEFKTPIISIRGFARLLQSERLTPAQRREYTDTIIRESERLAAMSTNVLLLSRYENTGIVTEKTRYPLDEQIRRCIALQERAWLEKDIDIEGELAPVTFYGSEGSLWSTSGRISSRTPFALRRPAGRSASSCGRRAGRSASPSPTRAAAWTSRRRRTSLISFIRVRRSRAPATGWGSPSCAARWSSAAGVSASRPPPAAAAASS